MPGPDSDFERFVRRVHRRYVALRLLEKSGIGMLGGCAAGVLLVTIAIWRAIPAASLAVASIVVGIAAGLLHGWVTRPTLHQTALEADRQLDTADLLSTALCSRGLEGPWNGAVRAAADVWSRRTAPSAVILNRLGARAWGGIGLATALLTVLAMLPTYSVSTQAADRSGSAITASESSSAQRTLTTTASRLRVTAQQDPEDLNSSRGRQDGRPADPSSSPAASGPDLPDHHSTTSVDPLGRGGAESHSQADPAMLPDSAEANADNDPAKSGRWATGVGRGSPESSSDATSAGHRAGSSVPTPPVPPWKSSQWPQDVQRAQHAVESGQVPDQYRDVIRGYFDRQ